MRMIIEKRYHAGLFLSAAVTVLSVFLAFVSGGFFIIYLGKDPLEIYCGIVKSVCGSIYGISETLVLAAPLMLASLGVAFALEMLLWNVGAEGQYLMGMFGAACVVLHADFIPASLMLPAMAVAAFSAGAIWSGIPGFLRARLQVNEIITTLLMNHIALFWLSYLVYGPWKDPNGYGFPNTVTFPVSASLPTLKEIFGISSGRLHAGLFISVIFCLVFRFILEKTWPGYRLKLSGESLEAARHSGVPVAWYTLMTMVISGGLAGLAGFIQLAGVEHRLTHQLARGYGYTAIIIAWLSGKNPLWIIINSILISGLVTGGELMQVKGVPASVVNIITSLILFFVLAGDFFRNYRIRFVRS